MAQKRCSPVLAERSSKPTSWREAEMPAEAIVGVAAFAGLFTLWTIAPTIIRKRGK